MWQTIRQEEFYPNPFLPPENFLGHIIFIILMLKLYLETYNRLELLKGVNNMTETKTTYEQFCTHQGKNIVMELTMYSDGTRKTRCINFDCPHNNANCQNKLIKK